MCIAAPGMMKCANEFTAGLSCHKHKALSVLNAACRKAPVVGDWVMYYRCPNYKMHSCYRTEAFERSVKMMVARLLGRPMEEEE